MILFFFYPSLQISLERGKLREDGVIVFIDFFSYDYEGSLSWEYGMRGSTP